MTHALEILTFFTQYGTDLAGIGAACVFIFGVIQFTLEYRHKVHVQEFETYHRLLKELVSPTDGGPVFVDRQVAAVFELRHYPRYFEITTRILEHLLENWRDLAPKFLRDEIERTLAFIKPKIKM